MLPGHIVTFVFIAPYKYPATTITTTELLWAGTTHSLSLGMAIFHLHSSLQTLFIQASMSECLKSCRLSQPPSLDACYQRQCDLLLSSSTTSTHQAYTQYAFVTYRVRIDCYNVVLTITTNFTKLQNSPGTPLLPACTQKFLEGASNVRDRTVSHTLSVHINNADKQVKLSSSQPYNNN